MDLWVKKREEWFWDERAVHIDIMRCSTFFMFLAVIRLT